MTLKNVMLMKQGSENKYSMFQFIKNIYTKRQN